MANRKPFDLRNTLVVYNLFQTVFSIWIFYEVSKSFLHRGENPLNIFFFGFEASKQKRDAFT